MDATLNSAAEGSRPSVNVYCTAKGLAATTCGGPVGALVIGESVGAKVTGDTVEGCSVGISVVGRAVDDDSVGLRVMGDNVGRLVTELRVGGGVLLGDWVVAEVLGAGVDGPKKNGATVCRRMVGAAVVGKNPLPFPFEFPFPFPLLEKNGAW